MKAHEFEEKVFPLKDRLFRFSLVWLKNREEAEDAVQEVLTRLWNMRSRLNKLNSIEAYAIQMVRYECLNRFKSRHRKWISLEKINEHMSDQHPEHALYRKEVFQALFSFISGLPEQQHLVIMLRDIEGLEVSEIESITNMSANNIRVTLSLARKKIAELYKAHEAYERK
jgi:RNA polymerase sigma factor (sigma-70 family)